MGTNGGLRNTRIWLAAKDGSFNYELHEWARIVNIAFRAAGRPRASAPPRLGERKINPFPPGGPDGAGPSTVTMPWRGENSYNPSARCEGSSAFRGPRFGRRLPEFDRSPAFATLWNTVHLPHEFEIP